MTYNPDCIVNYNDLTSAICDAFVETSRPSLDAMLDPAFESFTQPGFPSQYANFLDAHLTRFEWDKINLAKFHSDEGFLSAAELARYAFELLSTCGVGYYAPAAMLITLEQGRKAAPLLGFLIDQLDPDCVGEDKVSGAFGHWNPAQVDALLDFLSWAANEFPETTYENQHGAIREYWKARRKLLAFEAAEHCIAHRVPHSSDDLEPRQRSASRFKACVEKHGRDYDFNDLVPLYGEGFIGTLVDSWPAIFSHERKPSTMKWFSALKRALSVVASIGESVPESSAGQVYHHLRDRPLEPLDAALFCDALEMFINKLSDLSDKSFVKSETSERRIAIVYSLNGVLRRIARHRLLPSIGPLTIRLPTAQFQRTVPCLAELTSSGRANVPVTPGADLSLDAHVAAMLDLNLVRLAALRDCLNREFIAEYEAFKRGQAWLARTDLPDTDAIDAAIKRLNHKKESGKRGYKERSLDEGVADRLKRHLHLGSDDELKAVVVRQFHNRLSGAWRAQDLPNPYSVLVRRFGSPEIVRHLEATARATTAAFGLLLIDTAFNVASLSDLPVDPYVSKARHGKRRIATIAARKVRAKGKRVEGTLLGDGLIDGEEVDLPIRDSEERLSGIEIISRYLEMTKPLRARARRQRLPEVAEKFWILSGGRSANGGAITNDLNTMASVWWPAFIKRNADDNVIGGLPITRQNIRVTVLQIRSARNGFGHTIAQAVAEHARDSTTMSYLGAGWFRAQLTKQVRAFQQLFEASLAKGLEHAASLLGIEETEFARRVATAEDAGLDFGCPLHFEAETVPHYPAPTCNPAAPCEACPTRRFVPSRENFRLLCLAHMALKGAEPVLVVQNPERWFAVWLRWRALTEAYVRKIRRSPHKRQFEQVANAVEAEVQRGDVALPIIA